ncbi:MAG: MBL fold metallo-hydrolase, partial [Hyphomonadaceae bacterium]
VDVPHIRKQAKGNELSPSWGQHLGSAEGIELPVWTVSEWVAPNTAIDLGGRELVLLYTPGHTDNSVSLYDTDREVMFTGDFFTASGRMNAFTPTASLGDIVQSANKVLAATQAQPDVAFRGAHANVNNDIPVLGRNELSILRDQLLLIKAGQLKSQGTYPVVYVISEDINLLAEPRWLQDWSVTYPDDHPVH